MQYGIWNDLKLSTLCYIKIHLSILPLNGTFTHMWLHHMLHWSLGRYQFTEYEDLKCWYFSLYQLKKSQLLITPLISSAKSLIWGSSSVYGGAYKFFKILIFCLRAQIWSLATNTVVVHLEEIGSHQFIFKKMSAKYPRRNNQNLSMSYSLSKNGVPWKKQLVQLTTLITHECLFLVQQPNLDTQQKAIWIPPIHRIVLKRTCS